MKRNLVLYADGSRVLASNRKRQAVGWAFVACHDGHYEERHGAIAEGKHGVLGGYCEQIAATHALLYAKEQGFAFEDVTLMTDDATVGYAPTALAPENFRVIEATRIHERLGVVAQKCFTPDVIEVVMQGLLCSRVHKVKGHSFLVYQERVDYLARTAAWAACHETEAAPLSYDDWMEQGIPYYDWRADVKTTWHAPFSKPPVA